MNLKNTLDTANKEGNETVTFYHVSTDIEAFKSFFREGAKSTGKGLGGQTDGFYVWSNEEAAERHVSFLQDGAWANKHLNDKEAMIIGITVPKASVSYPLWQQDAEQPVGLFKLCASYGEFLNQKAQNLDIELPPENVPFGWPFSKITAISFEKKSDDWNCIFFEGFNDKGRKCRKMCPDRPPFEADDSIKFQILTDWLCQSNPDFKKDYDLLMQKTIMQKEGSGLKYTGSAPLPITFVQHIKINEDGSLEKTTIFDTKKGKNQVCPFLKMGLVHRKKEK